VHDVAQAHLRLQVGVEDVDRLRGARVKRVRALAGAFGVRHGEDADLAGLGVDADRLPLAVGEPWHVLLAIHGELEAERHALLERGD
jgi:hypothetical protein